MTRRTGRRAAALLAFALLLAGCWDHQPPESTAFILMIGLDAHPERSDQKTITQLAVLPSGLSSGEEAGQPEGSPFYLLSNTAHTLEGAQMAVVDHLSRLPRLDHLKALVLSEEVAREGKAVEPTIAWALRHPQIRPGVLLFITDQTAQQFLDATPALDPLPGGALMNLMRYSDRIPHVMPMHIYQFARSIVSPRFDGAVPIVRRINPLAVEVPPGFQQRPYVGFAGEGDGEDGESVEGESMDTQIKLAGMALFKGGTMVGTLMHEDGKGLNWIRGDSKVGLSIPHPEHSDNFVSAVTIRSSVRRQTRLEDGDRVVLAIDVEASMDVWGEGRLERLGVGPIVGNIETSLADTIVAQVRTTMAKLQELRVDIFGFGEELYRDAPRDWDQVAERWDDLYGEAEVDVTAAVHVRRTGLSR